MNRELEFAKKIEEIKNIAKDQGNVISKEQVEEIFASIDMSGQMLEPVYEYLNSKKIGIGEAVDIDKMLSEEDKNYLELYIEELNELNEYTPGEKEAYYLSAMAGHEESQKRVIEIMLPEVVDIAKLYTDQGVTIEDLIGEGNVALTMGVTMLGALESAREVPGALAQIIMNSMEDYIAEEGEIKKSDNKIVSKVNKVSEAAMELAESLGRKVTVEELANETGFSRKLIRDAIRFSGSKIEDIEDDRETDNNG